jgi:hypothetical protein
LRGCTGIDLAYVGCITERACYLKVAENLSRLQTGQPLA